VKVAIGSTNPVKLAAVQAAVEVLWPDEEVQVVSADVPSGVASQPLSESECIKGASNRAKTVRVTFKPDFAIGIEGGLVQVAGRWFVDTWVVAIDRRAQEGIGSAARTELAPKIMQLVWGGTELGAAEDAVFGTSDSKRGIGYIGILTDGALDRTAVIRDAVVMALARFRQPEVFSD
jgi:inosine/xanthosine triphosphatase